MYIIGKKKNISGFLENKLTWFIISLFNIEEAHLNKKCVFVRLIFLSKDLFPCGENCAALFYVIHSYSWSTNTSLYYTEIIRKRVHFSFAVEITSCRVIFCILKRTTRLDGSPGSYDYSTACYVLVQKDQRKKSFQVLEWGKLTPHTVRSYQILASHPQWSWEL